MWVGKTVSFAGTCVARSEKVLVSAPMMRAFRLRRIHIQFATGTQNLMALRFFVSADEEAPASGKPSGMSLLQDYGQVDYVRGEGCSLTLAHVVEAKEGGMWLKVHADNTDYYDHAIDVQMELEVEQKDGV